MEKLDARVDAYIAKSADFAKPVMEYLRGLVHETSPLLSETIKWGCPFFEYNGPVCQMVAFKQHCGFGFWKARLLNDPGNALKFGDEKAGSIGVIKSIADLPPKEVLADLILQAIALNKAENKTPVKKVVKEKGELVIPDYLTNALKENPPAFEKFDSMSASHKREYLDWITNAKTEVTRTKRIATTIEWLIEGKPRNWKYQ